MLLNDGFEKVRFTAPRLSVHADWLIMVRYGRA
ncbi:hypothetical protein AGI3411_04057 [Achromobacter agilis]|uniref:Uncharacterized protein n=1 Tax=Achromobacter agilis TaxID=1353888 RepID=A0A446CMQ0_9BURK|nr:hypothetical protein AGI3411_04057 [Achromobacter agilis]